MIRNVYGTTMAEFLLNDTDRTPPFFNKQDSFVLLNDSSNVVFDLRSDKNKIVLHVPLSIYHITMEILPITLDAIRDNLDVILIIESFPNNKPDLVEYINTVADFLSSKYDGTVTVLDNLNTNKVIVNNNFDLDRYQIGSDFHTIRQLVSDLKEIYPSLQDPIRNKKVYLSRKFLAKEPGDRYSPDAEFHDDNRIINETILENFFIENGFDIVCPEEFTSFKDQVNYFSNVNLIVSATSSGLTNAFFLDRGCSILEITTPFSVAYNVTGHKTPNRFLFTMHNQYAPMTFILDQDYARVQNQDRQAETIINKINNSKAIKGFLGI